MKIDFSMVPNSKGQGRIFYDGCEYLLPIALVGELQEAVEEHTQTKQLLYDARDRIHDLEWELEQARG